MRAVVQRVSRAAVRVDGAEVAAIGGFSGNESEVTAQWLADAVRDGKVRWVLTSGDSRGGISDGRTGSRSVMAAVAETCNPVDSVSGLYDCQGQEAALVERRLIKDFLRVE